MEDLIRQLSLVALDLRSVQDLPIGTLGCRELRASLRSLGADIKKTKATGRQAILLDSASAVIREIDRGLELWGTLSRKTIMQLAKAVVGLYDCREAAPKAPAEPQLALDLTRPTKKPPKGKASIKKQKRRDAILEILRAEDKRMASPEIGACLARMEIECGDDTVRADLKALADSRLVEHKKDRNRGEGYVFVNNAS